MVNDEPRVHLRQEAQVYSSHNPVSLPRPLGQNKTFRAFSPDDRSQKTKHHKWQGRGQSVDDQALNTSNGRDFWVREQNARAKGCL